MMKYEAPNMVIIRCEMMDIVTASANFSDPDQILENGGVGGSDSSKWSEWQ